MSMWLSAEATSRTRTSSARGSGVAIVPNRYVPGDSSRIHASIGLNLRNHVNGIGQHAYGDVVGASHLVAVGVDGPSGQVERDRLGARLGDARVGQVRP